MRNASIDVTLGIAGLRRVAFLLERELAPTYQVKLLSWRGTRRQIRGRVLR